MTRRIEKINLVEEITCQDMYGNPRYVLAAHTGSEMVRKIAELTDAINEMRSSERVYNPATGTYYTVEDGKIVGEESSSDDGVTHVTKTNDICTECGASGDCIERAPSWGRYKEIKKQHGLYGWNPDDKQENTVECQYNIGDGILTVFRGEDQNYAKLSEQQAVSLGFITGEDKQEGCEHYWECFAEWSDGAKGYKCSICGETKVDKQEDEEEVEMIYDPVSDVYLTVQNKRVIGKQSNN